MQEVHVIGAGPCGSVAALSALNEGRSVHLYEEHMKPGTPVNCSGLISREGLESLRDLADYKKHAVNRIRGAIFDCAGASLRIDSGRDIAYVIDRSTFDYSLAERAESEGAKLHCGSRITRLPPGGHIIGADGPNSTVAEHFGFPRIGRFAGASQALIRHESGMEDYVRVFLSNRRFPGFFGWLIPQNEEYAEIGAGCVLPSNPDAALDSLAVMLNTDLSGKKRTHSVIPLAQRKKTALSSGGRGVLLTGDAAGQVKSTTGGGVAFGTKCARLAGMHADSPEKYESSWRSLYGSDLDAHYHLHVSLGRLDDASIRTLGSIASAFRIEEFLRRDGNMDSPTRMINANLLLHPLRTLMQKIEA